MYKRIPLYVQKQLILSAQQGNTRSLNRLIESCLPFLQRIANHIAKRTGAIQTEEDLVQEGAIALQERVNNYNLESTARFENYAYRWVRSRMLQFACNSVSIVRLPNDSGVHGAYKDFEQGKSEDEIVNRWKIPRDAIVWLKRQTLSIDNHRRRESDKTTDCYAMLNLAKSYTSNEVVLSRRRKPHKTSINETIFIGDVQELDSLIDKRGYVESGDLEASTILIEECTHTISIQEEGYPIDSTYTLAWSRLPTRYQLALAMLIIIGSQEERAEVLGVSKSGVLALEGRAMRAFETAKEEVDFLYGDGE